MSATSPFEGLVVIDFTHVLAGPACSYYLGLLGSEVIKVESIGKGDAIRHRGGTDVKAAAEGMSTPYLTQGAGKKSIALDLDSASGKAVLNDLLSVADIFVENHLPNTLHALGFHEDTVLAAHPHLIYCAMTGYGRGGPQENAPAYDVNIQASCGIMEMTGTEENGPTRTGAPILDYGTAMAASFAISAALFERSKTGKGSFVDVSMLETGFALMSSTITDYYQTGNEPKRRGNMANSRSPGAGSFPCKEGVISLGVNEKSQFASLAEGLGRTDWLSDPRFADQADRKAHAQDLVAELEAELLKKTAHEWEVILQSAGVPCARLRTMAEALSSEQAQARGFVYEIQDIGLKVPTLPFRLNHADSHAPGTSPPQLGADTDDVMTWLRAKKAAK
ncbi:MAG: CoA transferase [Pseudomonadota bacterium]